MPDNKHDDFDDLLDSDLQFLIITDDTLICGLCKHCTGEVITCSKFKDRKPSSIFIFNYCGDFEPRHN